MLGVTYSFKVRSQTAQVQLVWLVYAWAICKTGKWSQIQEVGFLMYMCLAHERKSFIWSKWYELSVKWVNLSHSNQGGFLMHVCLAHDRKSMSMTSDHKVRWDQLVLHPPWNWLNIDSKTLFPKQGLIFRDLQSFHCGCLSVFLFPMSV